MRVDHGKVIGMVSIPGDRRDEDIVEMGRLSAGIFDFIVFREGPDGRGRPTGEVNALMYKGALEAGASPDRMRQVIIEKEAVNTCLEAGHPGDLVVILPRSEEHTSELQSLMRISYAVFCLKKKNNQRQ